MAANTGPTFLRITLGAELARVREKAGLTGDQAAKKAGCAASTITNLEKGSAGVRRIGIFTALLDAYGLGPDEQELLLDWYRNAKSDDWWTPMASVLPSGMSAYLGFESGARIIHTWCPMVVYGLLQTEEYARALLEAARPVEDTTGEFIDSTVEARMNRKRLITEGGIELVCVMDESALLNRVGDATVMRNQYEEIARLARLPNVTVKIVPSGAPAFRVTTGHFTVLDFDRHDLPGPVVASDTTSYETRVNSKPGTVKRYVRRFQALTSASLADHETPQLLQRISGKV